MKMNDYISLGDYKIIYGFRYSKQIVLYFVILMIFIIGFLLITLNFNYYTYYNGTFLLEDNGEYSFFINAFNTDKIPDKGVVINGNLKYKYVIKDISKITESEYIYVQKITLKIDLSKPVKIFKGSIVISKEKLFWYIINYLKGVRK